LDEKPITHRRYRGRSQGGIYPQTIPREQVDGHHSGNHRPANIHRNQCSGPLGNEWNDITHSEKLDLLLGQYPLLRQICDWNIEIAADERGEQ
jgi:hypothetical protein